jgi:NAD(P)-dependent dehydrogenase (short-subunit alcohol dehydrogenase family)
VITGGTSGMGLATAKLLLDQGARVLVTGSTKKTLDSAREELGKNAIVMSSDARLLRDIDALAARAKSEFGVVPGSRGRSVLTRSDSGLPVLAKHREHQHGPPDQRAAHVWKSTRRLSDAPSGSSPK